MDANAGNAKAKTGPKGRWTRTTVLWLFAAALFIACIIQNYRLDREDMAAIKDANDSHTAALRLRDVVGGPYPAYRDPPKASRGAVYFFAGAWLLFVALGVTCMPESRAKED